MDALEYDCILLRYSEIGLKSKRKKPLFERFYANAIRNALKRNNAPIYKMVNLGGRFVIYFDSNSSDIANGFIKEIISVLQKIPGVHSLSPAIKIEFKTKQELLNRVKELSKDLVKTRTFCARVKRIGNHDFSSLDLAADIGEVLYKESKGVSLKNPEIILHVEIRKDNAFFFTEIFQGIGGLPPRTTGNVLCLFSGGIDSPVAAYHLFKKGCEVNFLFINLMGEKNFDEVANIYNFLISQYAFGYTPKMHIVDGRKIMEKIKNEVEDKLKQVALKIAFYKIAEKIAVQEKYEAIATGESLSQKSTQTLQSLKIIESQISSFVIRPLIAYDKLETINMAKQIGTLAASEKIKECCGLAEGPVMAFPRETMLDKMPCFDELIEEEIKNSKIFRGMIELEESAENEECKCKHNEKECEKLINLKNAVRIDIRNNNPNRINIDADINIPYSEIIEKLEELDKKKEYAIICNFGVRSEEIAYLLRKKSIKAIGMNLKRYLKLTDKKS